MLVSWPNFHIHGKKHFFTHKGQSQTCLVPSLVPAKDKAARNISKARYSSTASWWPKFFPKNLEINTWALKKGIL